MLRISNSDYNYIYIRECYNFLMYYIIVALFMLIAPAVSTAIELSMGNCADLWATAGKFRINPCLM
ncbi:MAG: hypothetical protein JWO07_89 [Candidatus Saccharibacteria bacterium]|nr:hypothetical protein [Candidatus Saccharibacteria bacterium]